MVRALQAAVPSAKTLCYVVMPDHLHWLMQLQPGSQLSDTVRLVKSLATKNIQEFSPDIEAVWQRGFHDRALRKDEDIRAVARYVVANPLRAGLVRSVREYGFWDAVWL